ncbi:MAG TPA: L,D-transpeptidase [Thermoanaerobaculia bacterium]|nr:L,D-transpeptidase [Thermoanaerobaculia bacterium]
MSSPRFFSAALLLILLTVARPGPTWSLQVHAQEPAPAQAPASAVSAASGASPDRSGGGLKHARLANRTAIYRKPDLAGRPVRNAGVGFLMYTVEGPLEVGAEPWYKLRSGGYVQAANVQIVEPTAFHGIALKTDPPHPFGWLFRPARTVPAPGAAIPADAPELPRYTYCEILEEARDASGESWVRIGPDRWVQAAALRRVQVAKRPAGVRPGDLWIEIQLGQQTVAAYQGDRMVYASLISSGLDRFPTQQGLFTVGSRHRLDKMSGLAGTPDFYWVQDVPHALFFHGGTALHGAYWHDKFGTQVSHGCVNLPPEDAKWIWDWSAHATGRPLRIWVHSTSEHPAPSDPSTR